MGVSDLRVQIHTNNILKGYLQNGTIPDEFIVEQTVEQELAAFFDPNTNTFNAVVPMWTPENITYRQTSDFHQWNTTQTMSAEDMQILYLDFIDQVQILTNKLYNYVTSSVRLKTKLKKLTARIQNLLLVSTATDGFTFSFFDTFVDTSKTSFTDPFSTTAIVNPETQSVQIGNKTQFSLDGNLETTTSTLNLLFLQPSDVSFYVLNPLPPGGITPLSNTPLTGIFNNQATAWQQAITITGPGPIVGQLTVRVSPLDPIVINKISMVTKMSDAANQVIVQLLYSTDGVSYFEVPSDNSSQVVTGSAEFNFAPINAKFFRFIITKNQADNGATYNIGLQYISFQQVSYLDGGDFYSIPISFPDQRPISKLSLDTCTIIPPGTDILFSIIRGNSGPEIPISSIEDTNPQFSQVIDISSYTGVTATINTAAPSGYVWTPDTSGYLHMNVSNLITTSGVNPSGVFGDPTIPLTMSVFRNIGEPMSTQPYDSVGFQVNPSGLPAFFLTNVEMNNVQGINVAIGSNQVILDNQLITGTMSMAEGLHRVATTAFDQLQETISLNSDNYFAWNMKYVSIFDFYQNVQPTDQSFFTYDPTIGDIIINPIPITSQYPTVDYDASFVESLSHDGTFMSSSVALVVPSGGIIAPAILNAGESITMSVDTTEINPKAKWVNEIDITNILSAEPSTISVQSSMDTITWTDILSNEVGPPAGVIATGALRFPVPVYAKYFRVIWVTGSQIDTSNSRVNIYPPIFKVNNTVQSVILYQPTGTVWDRAYDTQNFAITQTLTVINAFDDANLGTFTEDGSWNTDLSSIHTPKMILIATSTDITIDPFLTQLQLIANPIANEVSKVMFDFINYSANSNIKQVTLHAALTSNFEGVTPELKNYRVKLL